ncbi:MAG: hypothetical protein KDA53_06860 [Hyphomonas sp.]|nr:hypothetical protein [Hyphomonas sp.]
MAAPFRWSLARREQLGSLIEDLPQRLVVSDAFLEAIRVTAARMLAFADDADLAFLGRTPESLFDYLSGCFDGVEGTPGLTLVPFSLRWAGALDTARPDQLQGLFEALRAAGVDSASIATGPRPRALVDFVARGGTMESFITALMREAEDAGTDWNGVQRRLRIIGLRVRTKNSPNTDRWQQKQDWLHHIPDTPILNVSADVMFMWYLGNHQPKTTESFHPGLWADDDRPRRPVTQDQRAALDFAVQLYDRGRTK